MRPASRPTGRTRLLWVGVVVLMLATSCSFTGGVGRSEAPSPVCAPPASEVSSSLGLKTSQLGRVAPAWGASRVSLMWRDPTVALVRVCNLRRAIDLRSLSFHQGRRPLRAIQAITSGTAALSAPHDIVFLLRPPRGRGKVTVVSNGRTIAAYPAVPTQSCSTRLSRTHTRITVGAWVDVQIRTANPLVQDAFTDTTVKRGDHPVNSAGFVDPNGTVHVTGPMWRAGRYTVRASVPRSPHQGVAGPQTVFTRTVRITEGLIDRCFVG